MELGGGKTFAPPHLPHMFGTLGVNLPHLPHHPNRAHDAWRLAATKIALHPYIYSQYEKMKRKIPQDHDCNIRLDQGRSQDSNIGGAINYKGGKQATFKSKWTYFTEFSLFFFDFAMVD
jgi:hypothetical protein